MELRKHEYYENHLWPRWVEKIKQSPKHVIFLHGIMGGLSNFQEVVDFFPKKGYKIIIPQLPLYSLPIIKTSVKYVSLVK